MLSVIRSNFLKRLIFLFPHRAYPLKIWITVNFNTAKPGTMRKNGMAFYIVCVTCYVEVTPQLFFVAEFVCERVQEKLICILASEWRTI